VCWVMNAWNLGKKKPASTCCGLEQEPVPFGHAWEWSEREGGGDPGPGVTGRWRRILHGGAWAIKSRFAYTKGELHLA
jgi:hypothetical protein